MYEYTLYSISHCLLAAEAELEGLNERFLKLQQDFESQLSASQQLEMEVNSI